MSSDVTPCFDVQAAATRDLEFLSTQVDALIAAWEEESSPPSLSRFVPSPPGPWTGWLLAELIKVDLEYRWQNRRAPKLLEEYLAEFPDLAPGGVIPRDLLYEEFHIRKQAGDMPKMEEYQLRFPTQAEPLRKLLGMEEPHISTTIVGGVGGKRKQPAAGEQIDDFDLLTELGKGAFASVFLARQRSMQRLVALKISADKGNESQTLAMLDHPHIVRVYDQRIVPERKLRLMYMQNIPGGTLQSVVEKVKRSSYLTRSGKLLLEVVDISLEKQGESPPAESSLRRRLSGTAWGEVVCWLGARLASGLAHAHQQGVLHRDVKPANVLLAADGSPKLADFNVSFSSKVDGATPAAYFGGSLAYMSPEQLEAADQDHDRQPEELDGRSDVFALGTMLWELLTGKRPFPEDVVDGDWGATLKSLRLGRYQGVPAEAIAQLPPNLPPGLQAVLLECLEPDLNKRPTAAMAARQFEHCLKPRVQSLLRPQRNRFRTFIEKRPLAMFVAVSLMSNLVMGGFNLAYNLIRIVENLNPDAKAYFLNVQVPIINGVSFSTGIAIGVWLCWPVFVGLRKLRQNEKLQSQELTDLRSKTVRLGDRITWVTILLWIPSGITFPLWLWLVFGQNSGLDPEDFYHFLASNMLCGLIACTQTFFLCTFEAMRNFYPRFLAADDVPHPQETAQLARLGKKCSTFFALAVTAPFLAIILFLWIPANNPATAAPAAVSEKQNATDAPPAKGEQLADALPENAEQKSQTKARWLMASLAGLGFLGSLLAYRLFRAIEGDLAALAGALDPSHESTTLTESFTSSSTFAR